MMTFKTISRIALLCAVAGTLGACANEKAADPALLSRGSGGGWPGPDFSGPAMTAPARAAEPAPAKAAAKPAEPARATTASGRGAQYMPAMSSGWNRSRLAYPTGEVTTSAVMLDLLTPQAARLGQNYEYQIHVTNLTNNALQNVVVNNDNFQNLGMVSSTPASSMNSGGKVTWNLGDFAAQETKVIRVVGKADKAGISSNCLGVTYNNVLCGTVQIVEPKLELAKTATPEALLCDTITIKYIASNKGTATLENVVIKDTLAAGLTVDGKNTIELPVGNLTPGQNVERTVIVKADKAGTFASPATATSGDLTTAPASASTIVRKPVLTVTCTTGEGKIYIGRDIVFNVVVKNTSDAVAANSMITAALPAGATLVSATDGGAASGNSVAWNLGNVAAGQERKLSFVVRSTNIGAVKSAISVSGTCVDPKTTECASEVVGIPALLLTGIDETDPIAVGMNEVYVLTILNQGTAPLTNVRLDCTMDEGDTMQYISSEGPTAATVTGKKISFAPIAVLAPKESRTYRITVKAIKEGQVSFTAESSSTEITRKLIKSETTNFFK